MLCFSHIALFDDSVDCDDAKKEAFQFFSSEVFLSRICLDPISSMTFKVEENEFDKLLQLVKLRNVINYQRFCITVISSFYKKKHKQNILVKKSVMHVGVQICIQTNWPLLKSVICVFFVWKGCVTASNGMTLDILSNIFKSEF